MKSRRVLLLHFDQPISLALKYNSLAAATCYRHGLGIEDKQHLKFIIVIFDFVELLCIVRCLF